MVDTNVLIDVFQADSRFGSTSMATLERVGLEAQLVINPVIYAELAAWIDTKERLNLLLPPDLFRNEPIPLDAAFMAGRAFRLYKERGGKKPRMLADFLIGAHATVQEYGLISRDRDYSRYFHITLLDPSKSHVF